MCNYTECDSNKTQKHRNSNIIPAIWLAGVLLVLVTVCSGCKSAAASEQISAAKIETVQEEVRDKAQPNKEDEKDLFTLAMVPEYSGNAYVDINDDVPFFSEEELTEENFQEYLRLLNNPDYVDVTFDEQSGGVSAIHRNHRFDKQMGPDGMKRGNYEQKAVEAFRKAGHSIILLQESAEVGKKQYDGLLDGVPCEIKSVEQMGRWTIRTKIGNAIKQRASIVVLFFPNANLFSPKWVEAGWKDFLDYTDSTECIPEIQLLCVVDDHIHIIEKPSW